MSAAPSNAGDEPPAPRRPEKAKQFSGVFLPELHAVRARRRRWRIEQLLGFLPALSGTPARIEEIASPPSTPSGSASSGPDALFDALKKHRRKTEKARWRLEQARTLAAAPSSPPPGREGPASGEGRPADGPQALRAAEEFMRAAEKWHTAALRYREARFEEAMARLRAHPPEPEGAARAEAEWERAEGILTAAADAVAAAAAEVGVERPSAAESGPGGREPAAQPPTDEALAAAYAVIRWHEDAIRRVLDVYHLAAPAERAAEEEKLFNLALHLARAEQRLFERAEVVLTSEERRQDCRQARTAAAQEVQRAWRAWNQARLDRAKGRPASPPAGPPPDGGGQAPPGGRGDVDRAGGEDDLLSDARRQALDEDLVGLSLSGGGIRSATFALGFMQGLAQLRLLGMIDYLSTVSGGGYVGAWFAAWVRREGSLANVERQLSPNRVSQAHATRYETPPGRPRDDEPEPVHHLRAYSRYLSPRYGPYSADTWTLFTSYLRNLFVNGVFLVPLAVVVVFLWRMLLHGYDAPFWKVLPQPGDWETLSDGPSVWRLVWTLAFAVSVAVGTFCLFVEEENLFEAEWKEGRDPKAEHVRSTHVGILGMLLATAVTGSWIFSIEPAEARAVCYEHANVLRFFGLTWANYWLDGWSPVARFAAGFAAPALLISAAARAYCWVRRVRWWRAADGDRGRWPPWNWRGLIASLVRAACFGLTLYLVLIVIWHLSYWAAQDRQRDLYCLLQTVGAPLIVGAMVLSGFGEMAFVGAWLSEYEREWRARLAACLLMGAAAWLVMGAATYYLPWLFDLLVQALSGWDPWQVPSTTLKAVVSGLWALISGGGAWAATRKAATDPLQAGAWWVRPLATIAPFVFLLGLAAGVSALGQAAIDGLWMHRPDVPSFLERAARGAWADLVLIVAALVLAVVFGCLTEVNRFSLHSLYANRLTRCYLGASRRKRPGSLGAPTGVPPSEPMRQRNLFTGFDPLDDLPLAELRTVGGKAPYAGPLPLVNCALNCLAGDELAYQDRRADAFVLTPEKCGGRLTGYASTPADEAYVRNLTLGRAMTISGAAVDPNMSGLSPPLTALMTVFNTRLGWWVENPAPRRRTWWRRWQARLRHRGARPPWHATPPGFGWPLLWEFFGLTNEDRPYVHLSDGGHFENLGVYELIRRRCRFIVVVDAGTDRTAASDNMAAMLRLVRTDFGVAVELDPTQLQLQDTSGYSLWHCVVGRIRYDEVDEAAVAGLLIYVQATLTGDEPPDLLQYAARCPDFPRQSTLNQFFDEAQFECYRALGHHAALRVFGDAADSWTGRATHPEGQRAEVQAVFARVRRQWFPPPPCTEAAWLGSAQLALQLEQRLAEAPGLTRFHLNVYPELRRLVPPRADPAPEVQEFRAVSQTLQVMEAAWTAMRLDAFHTHPLNRGWMDTFHRWTGCAAFQRYWPFLRAEYSQPFVEFCEDVLNLQRTRPVLNRAVADPATHALQRGWLDEQVEQFRIQRGWLDELDEQFRQEWADAGAELGLPAAFFGPRFISDLVERSRRRTTASGRPFVWFLRQWSQQGPSESSYCCGIVCAADSPLLGGRMEFFLWVRGPYRTLGIGAKAVRKVLQEIKEESAFDEATPRRLTAYYPLQGRGSGGRLGLERWMNFFFDNNFRRVTQPEVGVGSKFVWLERDINR